MIPVQKQRNKFLAYFLYWLKGKRDWTMHHAATGQTLRPLFCSTATTTHPRILVTARPSAEMQKQKRLDWSFVFTCQRGADVTLTPARLRKASSSGRGHVMFQSSGPVFVSAASWKLNVCGILVLLSSRKQTGAGTHLGLGRVTSVKFE